MLKSGTECWASAAQVGLFVSTGPLDGHDSAAAAASCRGPLSSFPFPFDFDFITSMCGAVGISHSPSSRTGTILTVQERRCPVSTPSFAFLRTRAFHGQRHDVGAGVYADKPSDRIPIWLPTSSAHVNLDTPNNFLEPVKLRIA